MSNLEEEMVATVVDPVAHAHPERLHAAYGWLRKNAPIARAEIENVDPFYVVTRHADILEISKDNRLFPYGDMPSTLANKEGVAQHHQLRAAQGRPLLYTLVQMDEPDHMKYRLLTQSWFMPANLKKLEARVRELAREAADKMVALGGECDFVNQVALHFPLRVIMEILGVPREDEPRMLRLTQELFAPTDPDLKREGAETPEERAAAIQAVIADFFGYFNAITEARRAHPVDDVASVIANAKVDGSPITPFDAVSYYIIVATAGHDTTSSSTAGGMWALAENPEQFAKVKADPSLIPGLVDESIRWTTPVRHFMRTASIDTTVGGKPVAKDDWFMLHYPSGNRDEEVFEDPFAFRVDRSPNRHLAFGYGAHVCLGQHLAKMEMRILWEELLPRLKSVEIAGDAKLSEANFVNGPKKLPLRYTLA